jgi:hypothetical protein
LWEYFLMIGAGQLDRTIRSLVSLGFSSSKFCLLFVGIFFIDTSQARRGIHRT